MQSVAQAAVSSASTSSVISVQINDAVSGDLIEKSPILADKIRQIDRRLDDIEASQ